MGSIARLLGAAVYTAACASLTVAPVPPERVANGVWGGEHLALTVTDAGARLEFDCASGEIDQPLTVDGAGRLAVKGVFVRQRPGPVRIDQTPTRQPARYDGRLAGETLTLDVVIAESDEKVGTYTVERGATPRVRRCR